MKKEFGFPKPNGLLRRRETADRKKAIEKNELDNKRESKKRDGFKCRFPLCECHKLRLRLESSHWEHKGAGGDPRGIRSETGNLCTLCTARHQLSGISIDRGTLRPKFLTSRGYDGPIAWEVSVADVARHVTEKGPGRGGWPEWFELARETAIQKWAPFSARQLFMLEVLADLGF